MVAVVAMIREIANPFPRWLFFNGGIQVYVVFDELATTNWRRPHRAASRKVRQRAEESILKAALATPKHIENSAQPSQPAENIADLANPSADLPASGAQDKHPPSQSTSQDPKTKRRKLTKGNDSNTKKTKQSSKKDTGSKPVLEQLDPFAGNSDASSAATYLLSIFPEEETSCWKDSQTRASVTLHNLLKVSSSPHPVLS
ncbi:actin 7 [Striga asiatica]|uniref:Actin 7 n=1 Tax=Striga asiatica TaxID=4170 RepID=A0A5A7QBJ5_STRAF|nr:actin 7 [Striga asiatica]